MPQQGGFLRCIRDLGQFRHGKPASPHPLESSSQGLVQARAPELEFVLDEPDHDIPVLALVDQCQEEALQLVDVRRFHHQVELVQDKHDRRSGRVREVSHEAEQRIHLRVFDGLRLADGLELLDHQVRRTREPAECDLSRLRTEDAQHAAEQRGLVAASDQALFDCAEVLFALPLRDVTPNLMEPFGIGFYEHRVMGQKQPIEERLELGVGLRRARDDPWAAQTVHDLVERPAKQRGRPRGRVAREGEDSLATDLPPQPREEMGLSRPAVSHQKTHARWVLRVGRHCTQVPPQHLGHFRMYALNIGESGRLFRPNLRLVDGISQEGVEVDELFVHRGPPSGVQ
ncbi:MAG: hypothetical protein ACREXS_05410 [Gammaproteobacteria bacterium]